MYFCATGVRKGKPLSVINPAPTQAAIDSASLTKPRAKANKADRATMAKTIMSSAFTLQRTLSAGGSHARNAF
jgi:hypothetical protein